MSELGRVHAIGPDPELHSQVAFLSAAARKKKLLVSCASQLFDLTRFGSVLFLLRR